MVNMEQCNLETLECGVKIYTLETHRDERGSLTEVFRNSWCHEQHFLQWNYFTNEANVLRGVHVHPVHTDYLIILTGSIMVGLLDLRKQSPTYFKSYLIELSSEPRQAIIIPNGIAHGLYSKGLSSYIIGIDQYWGTEDDLGCHWQSTKNHIPWPFEKPILSSRDQAEQCLELLQEQLDTVNIA